MDRHARPADIVGGGLLGLLLTWMRISRVTPIRAFARGYILVFQGTPLLMQIFLAYFGLALSGVDVPQVVAAAIAFTAYASAFFGEIGVARSRQFPARNGKARRRSA